MHLNAYEVFQLFKSMIDLCNSYTLSLEVLV